VAPSTLHVPNSPTCLCLGFWHFSDQAIFRAGVKVVIYLKRVHVGLVKLRFFPVSYLFWQFAKQCRGIGTDYMYVRESSDWNFISSQLTRC
jgi:hypothetical protein